MAANAPFITSPTPAGGWVAAIHEAGGMLLMRPGPELSSPLDEDDGDGPPEGFAIRQPRARASQSSIVMMTPQPPQLSNAWPDARPHRRHLDDERDDRDDDKDDREYGYHRGHEIDCCQDHRTGRA